MTKLLSRAERVSRINDEMKQRVLVLDGSMGAYLQGFGLKEEDFRKGHFEDHSSALKGNNDLLVLTRPDVIKQVHRAYLDAGVDIIETNTFSATTISQAEYSLQSAARDINIVGARIAREVCDEYEAKDGKPRIVAGALGPTTKLLSMSPDVGDPGKRDCTFDEMAKAYEEQVLGLIEGGSDILLIETITDTLNCKAALWAAWEAFDKTGDRIADLDFRNDHRQIRPHAFRPNR